MTAPSIAAWTWPLSLSRLVLSLTILLGSLALAAVPARAATPTPAEAYVDQITDKAITILSDKTLKPEGRYEAFHTLILANIDLDRIAAFALGRYAGAMRASGRYDEYKTLFGDYIARVYASRLSGYSGEKLKILKSMAHGSSDTVVFSTVQPGAAGGDPIPVNWRVTEKDGAQKILDVQIVGAWMSIEQQSQFSSIIANNGRDVTKLIDYLREEVGAPLEGGANPVPGPPPKQTAPQ